MHAHTHTHAHTHAHTHTYTCMHTTYACTHTHTHIHAHIHEHMNTCTHTHTHTHAHTHTHTCLPEVTPWLLVPVPNLEKSNYQQLPRDTQNTLGMPENRCPTTEASNITPCPWNILSHKASAAFEVSTYNNNQLGSSIVYAYTAHCIFTYGSGQYLASFPAGQRAGLGTRLGNTQDQVCL